MAVAIIQDQVVVPTLVDLTTFFYAHVPILQMTLIWTQLEVTSCPAERKTPDIDVVRPCEVVNNALTVTDSGVSYRIKKTIAIVRSSY